MINNNNHKFDRRFRTLSDPEDNDDFLLPEFDDEKIHVVPAGDAWDMFHSYVAIGSMQTLDLRTLLMSAVTLRHAFEYLQYDSKFVDIARNHGFIDSADPAVPKVEEWLRAECLSQLGVKVDWFEQLREIANFTKHAELSGKTSIFGDHPPTKVKRTGTIRQWEESRTHYSIWSLANQSSTIIRTELTMTAADKKSVAIDVEETLYQTRMFFLDLILAHRLERFNEHPVVLVDEGE